MEKLLELTDKPTMDEISHLQTCTNQQLESTLKKLQAFNAYSESRFKETFTKYKIATNLVHEMKSDLDWIIAKLHELKTKAKVQHPDFQFQTDQEED